LARALRVLDRRLDLPPVPHDPRVGEQPLDVPRPEPRDPVDVEALERFAESRPLPKDRQPGQPGLEALEAELLEQPRVVRERASPLLVVVREVVLVRARPRAASPAVRSDEEVLRRGVGHAPSSSFGYASHDGRSYFVRMRAISRA